METSKQRKLTLPEAVHKQVPPVNKDPNDYQFYAATFSIFTIK